MINNSIYHPFFTKTNIINYLKIDYSDIQRMVIINNECIVQVNDRSISIKMLDLLPEMLIARNKRSKELVVKPLSFTSFQVNNPFKDTKYLVSFENNNYQCTCEDYNNINEELNISPKLPCKHILATNYFLLKLR